MMKFCPNCGKEVASKFCPYCGCDIEKAITIQATPDMPETPAAPPAGEIPVITFEPEQPAQTEPEQPQVITFDAQEPQHKQPEPQPQPQVQPQPQQNTQQQAPQFNTQQQTGQQYSAPNNYSTYYIPPEKQKESVTEKTWFIILFLLIFWPLGLFFMWKAKKFSKTARVIITVAIGLLFVLNLTLTIIGLSAMEDDYYDDLYDYSYEDDSYDDYDDSYSGDAGSGAVIDGRTASEAAQSYLSAMNFSRTGLIEQLEYEGYSTADATAAVDACGADWNEQAVGSAKSYLDTFPDMTRTELIDQLEYEGFTKEQAEYGAKGAGL